MDKNWIQTFTGQRFYPLEPRMEDIRISDIAHALAHICRFTGHTNDFYSVAEHCVRVSYACPHEHALAGLLHDASEAYLVDVPSPVKHLPEFEPYRRAEAVLQAMIYRRFGLSEIEPPSVKEADGRLLSTEARDLMAPLREDWIVPHTPLPEKIDPWSVHTARERYTARFLQLTQSKGRP